MISHADLAEEDDKFTHMISHVDLASGEWPRVLMFSMYYHRTFFSYGHANMVKKNNPGVVSILDHMT
jgi:hypothetical protein